MATFSAAVYEPPDPSMPYVAVIVSGGEVTAAFAVSSVEEGEAKLRTVLAGLRRLAEEHETRGEPDA